MESDTDKVSKRVPVVGAEPDRRETPSHRLGQVSRVSAREAVSEQILALIKSGQLKPGDRLPSELELIAMTGVSRSSVREAIRSLTTMQLVEIRPGKGTFVRGVSPGGVTDAQILLLLEDRKALDDLVEVRIALEPVMARLAAERATAEDVLALERAAEGMRQAPDDAQWRVAHFAFHQALAEATHNTIMMKIWSLVAMFLKDSPLLRMKTTLPHLHDDLYEAIARRDVEQAHAAMQLHLSDMTQAVDE